MAVLTRPLFHAQERIDLEDFNQVLSGLRTDSRLWTRQFLNAQNYILKGFECSGEGVPTLSVSLYDSTFILAGRDDSDPNNVLESPGDLSFYTLESNVGPNDTSANLTVQILGGLRSSTADVTKRLYVYVQLATEEGTPITKAFWDPSANSGAGAEFNQRVNTAVDLSVNIEVVETRISEPADLLGRIEIAQIDVDSSGTIQNIIDRRPLLFELSEDFVFDTSGDFILLNANVIGATNFTVPQIGGSDPFTNDIDFILGETIYFVANQTTSPTLDEDSSGVHPNEFLRAVIQTDPGSDDAVALSLDSLSLPPGDTSGIRPIDNLQLVAARRTTAVGTDSGAVRIVEDMVHSFSRNDKSITNFKEMFDSVATEIKRLKGTDFWYNDPGASVLDVLRFINSTIVAESDSGRYSFSGGILTISDDTGTCDIPAHLTQAECLANAGGWTQTGANADDIATVRVFGQNAKFFLTRQDSATGVTDSTRAGLEPEGFIRDGGISLADNEVLYITLPDIDENFDDTRDYEYSGFIKYTDVDPTGANRTYWNTNDPIYGELNNPNTNNSFVGVYKVVPIDRYVHNDRNYWIAFREASSSVHIRDIGIIGLNELVPISSGVTNQTLSYIGAPDENTAIPTYPSITDIATHRDGPAIDGAYLFDDSGSTIDSNLFNESIIETDDNLTEAVDELNNHTTSLKDIQYQNLGVKLIGGGLVTLLTSSSLVIGDIAYIQVPGLPDIANTISGQTISLPDVDSIVYVDVNRIDPSPGGSTTLTIPAAVSVDAFVPARDRFVIARRFGTDVYVGTFSTTRFSPGDCSALDGELQFFGFTDSTIPKQLKLSPLADQQVMVGASDIFFRTGKDSETDGITLGLSIGAGLLSFEGARLDFSGTANDGTDPATAIVDGAGTAVDFPAGVGKILSLDGSTTFRGESAANSQFTLAVLNDAQQIWYSINLAEGETVDDASDPEAGKVQGNITVARGTATSFSDVVPYAEFEGDIPIGQIRVTQADGTANFLQDDGVTNIPAGDLLDLDDEDVVQLGSSGGGGGGGTGDASQDLNNFLNRLNLSIFEFMTPVVSAVTEQRDLIDATNSTDGIAIGSDGFGVLATQNLITLDLLDGEFTDLDEQLGTIEIIGIWKTLDGILRVDPNAQWYVTRDTSVVSPNLPLTPELNLTVENADLTAETLRISNHGLSHGHRVNFINDTNLGGLELTRPMGSSPAIADNNYYVEVVDLDNIALHSTREEADDSLTSTRIDITAFSGTVILTRREGVLDRIGITDTFRVAYTFSDTVATADQVIKIRVTGDEDAATQTKLTKRYYLH